MNINGYTTINQRTSTKRLSNIELAKRDLSNHFKIRKGEKWSNPNFGSNLPYYVFLPLDESTISLISADVYDVVTYDPRFELRNQIVKVDHDESYITIIIELVYLPTTTPTDLEIKFDKEFSEVNT